MKTIEEVKAEIAKKYGGVFADDVDDIVYTTAEFIEDVKRGSFNSFDGDGYFHDGEKETDISVWNRLVNSSDYPYVCWYNK